LGAALALGPPDVRHKAEEAADDPAGEERLLARREPAPEDAQGVAPGLEPDLGADEGNEPADEGLHQSNRRGCAGGEREERIQKAWGAIGRVASRPARARWPR